MCSFLSQSVVMGIRIKSSIGNHFILIIFIAPAGKRFDRFVPPPLRGAPFSKGAHFLPIESLVPSMFRHQPHLCELPNPEHVPFSSFPACTCLTPPSPHSRSSPHFGERAFTDRVIWPKYVSSSASYVRTGEPCACSILLISGLYLLDTPSPHSRSSLAKA